MFVVKIYYVECIFDAVKTPIYNTIQNVYII